MFESDTPCGRSENKVSNVITQPTVYDREKNTTQQLKTSKTPSSVHCCQFQVHLPTNKVKNLKRQLKDQAKVAQERELAAQEQKEAVEERERAAEEQVKYIYAFLIILDLASTGTPSMYQGACPYVHWELPYFLALPFLYFQFVLLELSSSPVPASCGKALLQAYRTDWGSRVNNMRAAICDTFPKPNRRLLQRILMTMEVVAENKDVNHMSLPAVATCTYVATTSSTPFGW
ncbi:rho GTPase activation protein, PH domain-like, Ternary complex factor MIP1, leucine-zipper [Artemisia annua]|uniref:Rho GTPase activation protein, PH domain-like, Ternary complex factor MIP1, leucine-zipper n=1 Tax=Artemisia annua TaxID=35608 RepID=A0A2U1KJM4_ARTAN|nr:rho GTPase activation protein, PH domain-like, Ternary complex factor MIP1, leucine-zipper [Artemisia annua]